MAQQAETYLTGNDLLSLCKSASQAHQNYCSGYVTGALDHQRLIEAMTRATKAVCIPANVTSKQLADVVVRDLEAKPAKRHYSATSLAIGALMDAFPCR
jgi:hypothetical protein